MKITLTPITPQQAFDAALFGIRKQQYRQALYANPAANGNMQCAYRGVNGDKCGFGHTLPDELYDPSMEGSAGYVVLLRNNDLHDFYSRCDGQMLTEMQGAHDNGLQEGNFEPGPERFEREMAQIARVYNLHYTPVVPA